MLRFAARRVAGLVLVAGAGVATLPYLATGHWARERVEGLASLTREADLPIRVDVLAYQRGVYGARVTLAVSGPGGGPGAPALLEGQVRHRVLGAVGTATLVDGDRAATGAGYPVTPPPLQPGLQWEVRLTPWARSPWQATATLHTPAGPWPGSPPGVEVTLSPATLSLVADGDRADTSLGLDGLAVTTRAGPAGILPVTVAASAVRARARLRVVPEGLAVDLDLTADRVESRGVPYIRLTGVRGSAVGVLARAGGQPLSLRHSLQADSNYGPVQARLALHGRPAGEAVDAEIEVEAPTRLARLLLTPHPETARRWRAEGSLREDGPRTSLGLRWSAPTPADPAPPAAHAGRVQGRPGVN